MGMLIVATILAVLPIAGGFPDEVTAAVNFFAPYVGIVDPLLPLDTLLRIATLTFALTLGVWTFRGLRWLYQFVPFVGK